MEEASNPFQDKLDMTKAKFRNPLTAHRSIYSTSLARCGTQDPFVELKILPDNFLDELNGRSKCEKCSKSRKFYCYTCHIPVPELKTLIPHIELPCQIDIIKHPLENDGKSTATHARLVAPEAVQIYTYPHFPDYDRDGVALIYPSDEAVQMESLVTASSDVRKLVFIDSTWLQAKKIFSDSRLQGLPCVILPAKKSVFWRYQRGKPDTHLATIEAIYYAVVELYKCRGNDYQDGRYDDLLFFFKYFYRQMNKMYFES